MTLAPTSLLGVGIIHRFNGLELTVQAGHGEDTAHFLEDLGFRQAGGEGLDRYVSLGSHPVSIDLREQDAPDQPTGYTALRVTVRGDVENLLRGLEASGMEVIRGEGRRGVRLGRVVPVYFEDPQGSLLTERRDAIKGRPRITKIDHIAIGVTPGRRTAVIEDLRRLGFTPPEEPTKRQIVRGLPGKGVLAETFIDDHKNVIVLISPLEGTESSLTQFLATRRGHSGRPEAALHHGGFMVVDMPHFVDALASHRTSTITFLTPDDALRARQTELLGRSFTGFPDETRALLLVHGIKVDPGGSWNVSGPNGRPSGHYLLQLNSQPLDGPAGSTFVELVGRKNGDFFDQGE